jgi:hypothetical protein
MLAKDVFAYFDPGHTPPRKSKTARALGVTPGLLTKWEKAGVIPEIWARRLADPGFRASKGIRRRFKFHRELYSEPQRECA